MRLQILADKEKDTGKEIEKNTAKNAFLHFLVLIDGI